MGERESGGGSVVGGTKERESSSVRTPTLEEAFDTLRDDEGELETRRMHHVTEGVHSCIVCACPVQSHDIMMIVGAVWGARMLARYGAPALEATTCETHRRLFVAAFALYEASESSACERVKARA